MSEREPVNTAAMNGRAAVEEPSFLIGNEFSEVEISRVHTRNGARLRIRDAITGKETRLCPLECESLTWQDPELFTSLLATPYGPEE